jgi:putative MATE family efflux protein
MQQTRFDRGIVEGPIAPAVWRLAWPTMVQNIIGGLQGIVDHAMVGHFVGFTGNAAIGVAFQIFLVVIVFVSSLFSGMAVLVARFAGANEPEKVNRAVYQAFLASLVLCLGVLAPAGWWLAPTLLDVINAAPEVQAEALPYLRIMFVGGIGMLMFYMFGAALRSAGDSRTPLRLGAILTLANITLNVIFIRGLGPIPAFGAAGAAIGTTLAGLLVSSIAVWKLCSGSLVVQWHRGLGLAPHWPTIKSLLRFGLPTGLQGIAMNVAGVLLLRFIGSLEHSAEAQAAYALGYSELFSLITWTSVGLMGAAAAFAGQNLGAGHPDRAIAGVHHAARIGLIIAVLVGTCFVVIPERLLAVFGMEQPLVLELGAQLLGFLAVSGLFVTVALTYTGGLQGTGDTRSPLLISIASQIVVPLGLCTVLQATIGLASHHVWLAIVLGHATRCALSVWRFRQGRWRTIVVE